MFLPSYVEFVQNKFKNSGIKSFIVGGAVRDFVMGKTPEDYDITVNADVSSIMNLVKKEGIHCFHIRKNTVVWLIEGKQIEISSLYRLDKEKNAEDLIVEDLKHRDFTINALAWCTASNRIIDPVGGIKDIKNKVIRFTGNSTERITEDPIRMLRACRLAGQLSFTIDDKTLNSIKQNREMLALSAAERVFSELIKGLLTDKAEYAFDLMRRTGLLNSKCSYNSNSKTKQVDILPEIARLYGIEQNKKFHDFDVWEHTFKVVEFLPKCSILRWAALLHDAGKGTEGIRKYKNGKPTDYGHEKAGKKIAHNILTRLKAPSYIKNRACWLVENHMLNTNNRSYKSVIKRLRNFSKEIKDKKNLKEAVDQLHKLKEADLKGHKSDKYMDKSELVLDVEKAIEENNKYFALMHELIDSIPLYVNELKINGNDVLEIFKDVKEFDKKVVGKILNDLLLLVQDGKLENKRNSLLKLLEKKKIKLTS
ncbi:CCA tRNA nucleotidyltransferase [Peptococcaceae bacterium]|nr:CCA tRNA nucleotidyltransferase [Peptococcaceae bacterium]